MSHRGSHVNAILRRSGDLRQEKVVEGRFDASNLKKQAGVVVELRDGQKFLFDPETARWRWIRIMGSPALEVEENGEITFQAFSIHVVCVSGPQTIFANATWKE
jgi:hypothetical protein